MATPPGQGGGIFSEGPNNNSATLTVNNSTISGNSASSGNGGGIFNNYFGGGGSMTLKNDTFSGNIGGAFYSDGTSCSGSCPTLSIRNTILNTLFGANLTLIATGITSDDYNLSSDNGGGFLTGPGDQINTNSNGAAAG